MGDLTYMSCPITTVFSIITTHRPDIMVERYKGTLEILGGILHLDGRLPSDSADSVSVDNALLP